MNWNDFWDKQAQATEPHVQVGRVGVPVESDIWQKVASHIMQLLKLSNQDRLLDVCCGNGLLTGMLSAQCKNITGLDFSEGLIQRARQRFPELEFICMDILHPDFEKFRGQYDKINLYFSFQYFESEAQGEKVISNLIELLRPGGIILLGDIPDRKSFFTYYRTPKRWLQYLKQTITGNNDMGKFWSGKELDRICKRLKVKGQKFSQPHGLPYASYRMDYLITK